MGYYLFTPATFSAAGGVHFSVSCVIWRRCTGRWMVLQRTVLQGRGRKTLRPPARPPGRSVGRSGEPHHSRQASNSVWGIMRRSPAAAAPAATGHSLVWESCWGEHFAAAPPVVGGGRVDLALSAHSECPYYRSRLRSWRGFWAGRRGSWTDRRRNGARRLSKVLWRSWKRQDSWRSWRKPSPHRTSAPNA